MAEFNLAVGGTTKLPATNTDRISMVKKVFDATAQNLAQNDIANLINVPAETFVALVKYKITKVEGGARNFEIGDGTDPNGFITTTSGNALGSGVSGPVVLTEGTPNTVTGFSGGKYYSAADTIDLKAVTAGGLTGCKVEVTAMMVDMS